ncbi:MAG: hypothetical protein AAFV51_10460 [Pseudomonadota bacterium]
MMKFVFAASAALAALASAAALADDAQQLSAMDTDKNGSVSRDEMTAYASSVFAKLDTNGDETVSFEEMKADAEADRKQLREQTGRRRGPRAEQLKARMDDALKSSFDSLDKDDNGSLSLKEHLAAYEPSFNKADANKDDIVDADEMRAMVTERLDARRGRRQ